MQCSGAGGVQCQLSVPPTGRISPPLSAMNSCARANVCVSSEMLVESCKTELFRCQEQQCQETVDAEWAPLARRYMRRQHQKHKTPNHRQENAGTRTMIVFSQRPTSLSASVMFPTPASRCETIPLVTRRHGSGRAEGPWE